MPDAPQPAPAAKSTPKKKLPRKAGKPSRWARSFEDLGARLVPPRERKTLQRAMRRPDLPGDCKRKADGRYDVAAWQRWLDAAGAVGHTEAAPKPEPLGIEAQIKTERLRGERLANERIEIANNLARGVSILKADAIRDVADLFAQLKREVFGVIDEVAPLVIAKPNPAEARVYMRERFAVAFRKLSTAGVKAFTDAPKQPQLPSSDAVPASTPAPAAG